jgi:lipopolysaccharide export system protein LptA
MNLNKTLTISFFFAFCSLIIVLANLEKKFFDPSSKTIDEVVKISNSRFGILFAPKIFHVKDEVPSIFLSAEVAKIDLILEDAYLEKLEGKSFNLERNPVTYLAEKGQYDKSNSELKLDGNVLIKEDGSTLNASRVVYKLNKDEILGEGDVAFKGVAPKSKDTIFIKAQKFSHFPKRKITSFKENIDGKIQRREAYREGINFQTDLLDYYQQELRISLTGNVLFTRKPFSASSRNGQIYLNNHNKLNYFILNDDVKLKEVIEEKGKQFIRKAFAEKMEGFPDEGKLILTGYPRVFQENEVIKGIRIIVRENSNVVEVEEANTTIKLQKGTDGKNLFDGE